MSEASSTPFPPSPPAPLDLRPHELSWLRRSNLSGSHRDVFTELRGSLRWSPTSSQFTCVYGRALRALTPEGNDHLEVETLAVAPAARAELRAALELSLASVRSRFAGNELPLRHIAVESRRVRVAVANGASERSEFCAEAVAEREGVAVAGMSATTRDLELHRRYKADANAHAGTGRARVLLSPQAAGVFFHELIGHGAERGAAGEPSLLSSRDLIGPATLQASDDPRLAQRGGSFLVDDEGTTAAPRTLVAGGRVIGELADRRARLWNDRSPAGNGRRESFRDAPLPRMSNLSVAPGTRAESALASSAWAHVERVESGALSTDGASVRLFGASAVRDGRALNLTTVTIAREALVEAELGERVALTACARCGRLGMVVLVSVESPALLIEAELQW